MPKSIPSSKKRLGYIVVGVAIILTAAAFGAAKVHKNLKKLEDDLSRW